MEPYSDRVTRCGDGKYRWVYEYPMLKNPTILLTTLTLFLLCGLAPVEIVVLSSLSREGIDALVSGLQVYGILVLIALPLTLISYGILAMNYGWTYIVLFEMDETGITHLQQPRQFQKAQGFAIAAHCPQAKKSVAFGAFAKRNA